MRESLRRPAGALTECLHTVGTSLLSPRSGPPPTLTATCSALPSALRKQNLRVSQQAVREFPQGFHCDEVWTFTVYGWSYEPVWAPLKMYHAQQYRSYSTAAAVAAQEHGLVPSINSCLWNWLLLCRTTSSKGPSDCTEGSSVWLPAATGWLSAGCCPANCRHKTSDIQLACGTMNSSTRCLTLSWQPAPGLPAQVLLDLPPEAAHVLERLLGQSQTQLRPCLQGSRGHCMDFRQALAAKH